MSIQGLIFEVDTNLDRDLGIRWGRATSRAPRPATRPDGTRPRVVAGGAGPSGDGGDSPLPVMFDFPARRWRRARAARSASSSARCPAARHLDAEITALEQAGKGKVISRPKVITLNNSEAVIQSLEILRVRLPSTGTVINTGMGGVAGGQTTATQAIDTGITCASRRRSRRTATS